MSPLLRGVTMIEARIRAADLLAGRYRLSGAVHREGGRAGRYGEETGSGRRVYVTGARLPALPDEDDGAGPGQDRRDDQEHRRGDLGGRGGQSGQDDRRGRDHGGAVGRTAGRVLRDTAAVERVRPGRVAAVVDVFERRGTLWTVIAAPAGVPLYRLLDERGPLEHVRAARIALRLLDVLGAAHREGVTHGDLSPGQVFVDERDEVTVTGFGVVGPVPARRVTAPSYAAPEQDRAERAGPECDLWAVGALLHTMVEGRPPHRGRGRPDAAHRTARHLPEPAPHHPGLLELAVQGLLREDPRERVTEEVVRGVLARVVAGVPDGEAAGPAGPGGPAGRRTVRRAGSPGNARTGPPGTARAGSPETARTGPPETARPGTPGAGRFARRPAGAPAPRFPDGRKAALACALAATAVSAGVLAATGGPGAGETSSAASSSSASLPAPGSVPSSGPGDASSGPDTGGTAPPSAPQEGASSPAGTSPSPAAPATPTGEDPPPGFRRYEAPQGFSVEVPEDFAPLSTRGSPQVSYRVVLGAGGDRRTLTVTYSTRLGPDPVDVWAELEPSLRAKTAGYARVGDIRAVRYRGRPAADMEWLSAAGGARDRTFGRGCLLGGGRGFSLRWTAAAEEWDTPGNRRALDTVLRSFREPAP
ncbi:serine/threonine-protein kinase [Streptomyces minutiscleroticus]|uniref:Protein kinase domain-containing protein n=1 Tax=Streptomyces minutiscleroticus TaxID=68238 RepID=A0A918KTY1_9ACTN|nr:serine/threonine protein kinase [Streptomyces minutiscleroticus]GGX75985.1 hypothetical protein GCM10010358_32960 [Streptomyces minutiscleroticus]